MGLTRVIFKEWRRLVFSAVNSRDPNYNVFWKNGWHLNFWYLLNSSWHLMQSSELPRKHFESCWDPDYNLN